MMIPNARLTVEMQPMNPPKPLAFGVFADDRLIAMLSYDETKRALVQYEAMYLARYGAAPGSPVGVAPPST
jgi:hypothetical protein